MKQAFIEKRFQAKTVAVIDQANAIITEYQAQGFVLTLRQLYYQFVARDLIANTQQSYDRIGSILNDARLAGLVDWEAIEDRTRSLAVNLRLNNPRHGLELLRDQWYGIDMWANQPQRVEVWIEKEALAGVIAGVCGELDVPYFACRGYVSQSEQWRAYRRHAYAQNANDQETVILHLGDHDPSGIDMTRDNQDRLDLFHGYRESYVKRIALTMDQINEYEPPPNFAKQTDSRFAAYAAEFGTDSYELDALEPAMLVELIRDWVGRFRDDDLMAVKEVQRDADLATLTEFIDGLEE